MGSDTGSGEFLLRAAIRASVDDNHLVRIPDLDFAAIRWTAWHASRHIAPVFAGASVSAACVVSFPVFEIPEQVTSAKVTLFPPFTGSAASFR